jgi:multidrug efflux system membrane fusion protein
MRLLLLACAALAACGKGSSSDTPKQGGRGGGRKLEYPVDVATLETRHLQYSVTAPGSIEAFQQVQITARVGGAVDKVAFTEGQVVNKGDVLAVIESERYQIAVDQANAAFAKAQATQKAAEMALQRRQKAQDLSPGLVPGEEIEQKQASFDTAKADVSAAKEQLHIAQLNLRDSQVRTPIAGVVQTRTVQQGQYLAAGYVLATILQREPLLVRFQVSEQDAPRLKSGQTANVTLKESRDTFTAKLTLVADAADPTTRMVPVTAQLDPTRAMASWCPRSPCSPPRRATSSTSTTRTRAWCTRRSCSSACTRRRATWRSAARPPTRSSPGCRWSCTASSRSPTARP